MPVEGNSVKTARSALVYVAAILIAVGCASCPRCGGSSTRISDRERPNQIDPLQFQDLELANAEELQDLRDQLDEANEDREDLNRQLEALIADKNDAFNALGINDSLGFGAINPNIVDNTAPSVALNTPSASTAIDNPTSSNVRRLSPAPLETGSSTLRTHGS